MKKLPVLILALVTISASAQWGKRIKGNGNVVTIERNVGSYDAIAAAGWFDVILVDGKEGQLTLKGEENLLEYIETEVKNGTLTIKKEKGVNLKSSNWKGGIIITVPVEQVNSVSLSGSGDVVSKTTLKAERFNASLAGSGDVDLSVEADYFKASLSGSGDMVFTGNAKDFVVSVAGSGDIKAFDLEAENVEANVSGSADLKVTANQAIRARVAGSGDITYKGNPGKVDSKTAGSGDISSY
ncbi:head GIN domain-containing protein [Flagellimonas sp. DF-77]|uniref:head GIN domain-containing protein n=1 Tax=Flagellimonas algarum TaxID=3230298 RepID=UPI0033921A45